MRSNGGIRLGSVAGIPIYLDYSFFLIFILLIVLLGADVLPGMIDPDPSDTVIWGLALASGVIFFASLLLHELAHSLVARLYGLPVANITLFMLGGVSQITREPAKASQEFWVAVVGPLTSLLLGLLFLALFELGGLDDSPEGAMVLYLGVINIALAVFNMIPGFPLDGGRVFRSILWALTGSQARATRWAARVGQGFALLLALVGGLNFIGGSLGWDVVPVGGLLWIFIGLFLYNAASQALRGVEAEEVLGGMPVRDLMSTRLRTVDADTAVRLILAQRVGLDDAFLVTRDDVVVGLITGAQLADLKPDRPESATLGDIMTPADQVSPIDPAASGREALERLREADVLVLPVVENGRLLGLVGLTQVLHALQQRAAGAQG